MKNRLIIGLFFCTALIQVATPLSMIIKREYVLSNGEQYRFKTAPVDPYDAFRGRYVALRIEQDKVTSAKALQFKPGQKVYVHIVVDEQGFAKFSDVTKVRPQAAPYIQAKVRYAHGNTVSLDLPFDRYYMEEKAAPRAERVYTRHSTPGKRDAYVVVRVKDGYAVIEGLYVGGKPIEEAAKQQ